MSVAVTIANGGGSIHADDCQTCLARLAVGESIALHDDTETKVVLRPRKGAKGVITWVISNA